MRRLPIVLVATRLCTFAPAENLLQNPDFAALDGWLIPADSGWARADDAGPEAGPTLVYTGGTGRSAQQTMQFVTPNATHEIRVMLYSDGTLRPIACFEGRYPAAMKSFADDLQASLAYLQLVAHRKYVRSTNLIECSFVDKRRRTKVIPRFFAERSCLKLAFGVPERAARRWQRVSITELAHASWRCCVTSLNPDPPPGTKRTETLAAWDAHARTPFLTHFGPDRHWSALLHPYLKNAQIFTCPSSTSSLNVPINYNYAYTSVVCAPAPAFWDAHLPSTGDDRSR